jgi:hypothetical protein
VARAVQRVGAPFWEITISIYPTGYEPFVLAKFNETRRLEEIRTVVQARQQSASLLVALKEFSSDDDPTVSGIESL